MAGSDGPSTSAGPQQGAAAHAANQPQHSFARGPSRGMLIGLVAFIGVAVYVLIITHHLKIDTHGLHLQSHSRSSGGTSGAAQLVRRPAVDPEAASSFVQRMTQLGAFTKYDSNQDSQLSQGEFQAFLQDLAKSKILDPLALSNHHGMAADLVVKEKAAKPAKAADSAAATAAGQQAQAAKSAASGGSSSTALAVIPKAEGGAGQCPELSRELVASFAKDSTVMLTVSDWRIFQTFGVNWMKHLQRLGVDYFIVGATDKQTSAFLGSQGKHPCFKFFEDGPDHSDKEYKYGSAHYNAATWRKVTVVQQIVAWGFNVLHSDVDVVWFRDPLPYMLGQPLQHVDMAVSTDLVSTQNKHGDDGLEVSIHQHVNLNTGVYFVKSTPGGKSFMQAWAGLRQSLGRDNDQFGLYHWMRGRPAAVHHNERYMQLTADASTVPIRVGLFSVSMLLNGYSYFIPQLHVRQNVSALGIHLTWVPLSKEGKFHRMRDGMLYNDAPEYYNGPMFVTGDIDFPPTPPDYNSKTDIEEMIQTHLANMHIQLKQMYRVMAVAVIMNRTLVLPKLQCFCYKNWFMMERCRIPGDMATVFPMECQMDQWLRPKVVYNYGPNIVGADGPRTFQFREHTFFTNPNFPKQQLPMEILVEPGDVPEPKLDTTGPKVKFLIPKGGLKQAALKAALEGLGTSANIIRIRKPSEVFAGWDDDKLKASFEAFLDKAAGNWCCRDKPVIKQGKKEKEKLAITW